MPGLVLSFNRNIVCACMEEYSIRELRREDLTRDYFLLLSELTTAPFPEEALLFERYEFMQRHKETYLVLVIVDTANRIVGSGTLVTEYKFLRNLGSVGHIEDIVVSKQQRGAGLGKKLIFALLKASQEKGAYKTILATSPENAPFYEKCGLVKKEIEMAQYHSE
ncbi:glucosamine-phosphate N-acetyltransferase [Nematocida homosporus]|uniref:glucosamine-phosphate N-acetyltransferase n=1 Tax=Nematocida homosporus TaxID=1912981 RepID=UPI00221FE913|nr:glucosamine-phosphate N-acetyltransferase [Nematocida homosporus]KAI5185635.1 glucosamine-phosphate N-acetyltransferase [Nematocida homosporus]